MTVYETEVPGVGRKFEMEVGGGERLIVIIHHDGKRELYRQPAENVDSERLLSMNGRQARRLGNILEGTYFQPVRTEDVQVPLGEAIIEWVDVEADSPVAGQTLADSNIRSETGVSVVAVQRGEETVANPKPEFGIQAGDILVALGTREEQRALSELVHPGSSG